MKKIIWPIAIGVLTLSIFTVSCKKETVTTFVETPSATNSTPYSINYLGIYNGSQCNPGFGFCITISKTRDEWANYDLQLNEGKGEAWATDLGNGERKISLFSGTNKLSKELADSMWLGRVFKLEDDCYLSKELVTSCYKKAGIKDTPQALKIPKGRYDVVFDNEPITPSPTVYKWVITIEPIFKDGELVGIRIKIKWVEP